MKTRALLAACGRAAAALAAFARGFVGIPAHAQECRDARAARESLGDAAARRGRCC
ncbi:MAG TPA: hypothetical protein VMR86_05280 [Myxococcota bacterium]|nr:hypothetical protein [Myxococcota bacterium]